MIHIILQLLKTNNSNTELRDTNNKTTKVHIKLNTFLLKQISLTNTVSLKIPLYVK